MLKLLPGQLPWWLGGPGVGLCVPADMSAAATQEPSHATAG